VSKAAKRPRSEPKASEGGPLQSAAPPAGLTRANLAERSLVCLERGGRLSPDVWLVESAAGRVVVKDFAARGRLVRATLGRWLVRHECRIHRRLAAHPAVPRLLGRVDAFAFVLEHRGGVRFSRRRPWTFSPEFGDRLDACVRELHALGVVHLDLRHRSNVRVGLDGAPVLIDFGSALGFRPGGIAQRLLLPLLGLADRSAVRKWRRRLSVQTPAGTAGGASDGSRGASLPTK
jgi:hypothetical protein